MARTGVLILGIIAFLAGWLISGGLPPEASLIVGLCLMASLLVALTGWTIRTRAMSKRQDLVEEAIAQAHQQAALLSEVANTLGATLDYQEVLQSVLNIGTINLKLSDRTEGRLVGIIMLFDGKNGNLAVVKARGVPPRDLAVRLPAEQGILAQAFDQAEPIYSGGVDRDPELAYFYALRGMRSVLIIPMRAGFESYGVLIFAAPKSDAFSQEQKALLTAISTQATVALQNAVLYQNLRQERDKIVEVEEEARKKLARDLHDGPTQTISTVAMRLDHLRMMVIKKQPVDLPTELKKIEDIARDSIKQIRTMLFTLRPLALESQGIVAALEQLAQKMKDTHNLPMTVAADRGVGEYIEKTKQGQLFYIIEEAVNNARKYAQSEKIDVRLQRRNQYVVVEVQDYGVGFDVSAVTENYESRGSLGMLNMQERAESVGARFNLESEPGKGTKITLTLPIKNGQQITPGASRVESDDPRQAMASS